MGTFNNQSSHVIFFLEFGKGRKGVPFFIAFICKVPYLNNVEVLNYFITLLLSRDLVPSKHNIYTFGNESTHVSFFSELSFPCSMEVSCFPSYLHLNEVKEKGKSFLHCFCCNVRKGFKLFFLFKKKFKLGIFVAKSTQETSQCWVDHLNLPFGFASYNSMTWVNTMFFILIF